MCVLNIYLVALMLCELDFELTWRQFFVGEPTQLGKPSTGPHVGEEHAANPSGISAWSWISKIGAFPQIKIFKSIL